jgi:endonuclease/exonuclease/phosphatase family metal-dependent hydrolase
MRAANRTIHFDAAVGTGKQGLLATLLVEDTPVTLMNLHFEPQAIGRQVENVLGWAQQVDTPIVPMGDFNCLPDDPALTPIRKTWSDTCRATAAAGTREVETVGTLIRQRARIDYVFVDPHVFRVEDAGLVPERHRRVSDHIGYFADVRLIDRSQL